MYAKKPGGKHKAFRIVSAKPYKTLTDNEELNAINTEYLEGRLTFERAHLQVMALAKKLRPIVKKPISWLPENLALADAFWKAKIKPKRSNVAPKEAERRVKTAVKRLGAVSILTASEDDLYEAINNCTALKDYVDKDRTGLKVSKSSDRKKCASVINSIMRWKGMNKFIQTDRVTRTEPEYLTLPELRKVIMASPDLKPEWRLCILAAFATGCRYGELFALTELSLQNKGTHVFIGGQIKRNGLWSEVKNRKVGTAYVVSELRDDLEKWVKLPKEVKLEIRRKELPGRFFKDATWKVVTKDLTFHNLRHSYARYMLTRNEGKAPETIKAATLTKLRQWMRDQLSTIEKYYTPWVTTSDEMESEVQLYG